MGNEFGIHLRCLRMGFRWSKLYGTYIRISIIPEKDSPFQVPAYRVDVNPRDCLPESRDKVKEHICWWEAGDRDDILTSCKPLVELHDKNLRNRDHRTFYVNDQGYELSV